MENKEIAIIAGGCFWGMEGLFQRKEGILDTAVGYIGGTISNPTYEQVKTGTTGHAEALKITFDPSLISFRKILLFFFQIHDPSTKNQQGNDRGTSYRSAIYTENQEQYQIALDTIADVDASGLWPGPVVTEIEAVGDFWEAEPDHQDYLERYPTGYTCHAIRPEWKLPS